MHSYPNVFGDLIHIDVKKQARFRKVGHRITGNRQQGRSAGVGYERINVAIDDATRLAYVEVLADEQQATAIGFMSRTVAWFNSLGVECRQVMSDNAPAYVSRLLPRLASFRLQAHPRQALHPQDQWHGRPLWPPADFVYIQTLCREWDYGMPFQNSEKRNTWLPRHLSIYTGLESPQHLAASHLSSVSMSCSADQRGETQHLQEGDWIRLK